MRSMWHSPALPGWEGLWFQGVGAHLQEDFPFVTNGDVADMIVASPQLEDWGETSARQTIALTQWLLSTYNVAADRMVLSGCSGGGETASLVMGTRPELFAAVLHCISQWDGVSSLLSLPGFPFTWPQARMTTTTVRARCGKPMRSCEADTWRLIHSIRQRCSDLRRYWSRLAL